MLGSKGILRERNKRNIIISPFNLEQLNPNSYDVRLGEWFIRPALTHAPIDLELSNSSLSLWLKPFQLNGDKFLVLSPGETVLAHTNEFIGSTKHATLLKARSTFGRLFIDICPSAGFGDVGYINRWTLEIKNNSDHHYILKPGMRIAQISFSEVKGIGKKYVGSYQPISGNVFLPFSQWKPEDMLPKLGHSRIF